MERRAIPKLARRWQPERIVFPEERGKRLAKQDELIDVPADAAGESRSSGTFQGEQQSAVRFGRIHTSERQKQQRKADINAQAEQEAQAAAGSERKNPIGRRVNAD